MKKFLSLLLVFLLVLGLAFTLASCNGDEGGNASGGDTNGGDTNGGENAPPLGPQKLDALAGKTAEELYLAIETYFSGLENYTYTGKATTTSTAASGEKSTEVVTATMKQTAAAFEMQGTETYDGESLMDMHIIYDGNTVYVDMGEDMRYKMDMARDEFFEMFGEDMLNGYEHFVPFSAYSEAVIYKDGEQYYLDLKGNPAALDEDALASLLPFGGVVSEFSYRFYLDGNGRLLSEKTVLKYTMTEGWEMLTCEEISEGTLKDVGTTRVSAPSNADDYMDAGDVDPDPDIPDYQERFSVIFKYVDPNGNPIVDKQGYVETFKTLTFGNRIALPYMNDVTAFSNYVIVGWVDEDGLEYDAETVGYIGKNTTLYSVTREKKTFEVGFYSSNGNLFKTATVKEGEPVSSAGVNPPMEAGKYFKRWLITDPLNPSSASCILSECAFVAEMGATDGTIGKVAAGAIVLDGKRDALYDAKGAYVAHNNQTSADGSKFVRNGGKRADPDISANSYAVWDGDYVYLLIEVWDKDLCLRSEAYVKTGIDAWCNDAVELWYTFEQDANITTNETRVGFASSGGNKANGVSAKFALGRNMGIFGGRSTHYEDIEIAVRNSAMGAEGTDLDATGKTAPSYIVEFKIPAYTEGQADMSRALDAYGNPLEGAALERFRKTGRLYGLEASDNNIENYAFTDGEKLSAGSVVRFNIQIDDLKFSAEKMKGFLDTPTLEEARKLDPSLLSLPYSITKLYELDATTGRLKSVSHNYYFTATGSTQRNVNKYLWFTLGDEQSVPESKVWSFRENPANLSNPFMLDQQGNVYTR